MVGSPPAPARNEICCDSSRNETGLPFSHSTNPRRSVSASFVKYFSVRLSAGSATKPVRCIS